MPHSSVEDLKMFKNKTLEKKCYILQELTKILKVF